MSIKKKVQIPVIIEQDEDGIYIVSCPQFKACHTFGKTVDEALSNLREVIQICVEENGTNYMNQFIGFREFEMELS